MVDYIQANPVALNLNLENCCHHRAWHMPAMFGCSTICPNCKHQFSCCASPTVPQSPSCCTIRRNMHVLSGGGLITVPSSTMTIAATPPQLLTPTIPAPLTAVTTATTTTTTTASGSNMILRSPCASPQISPSIPLAFVIPAPFVAVTPVTQLVDVQQETEYERLSNTVRTLRLSGWYYEGIPFEKSNELLRNTKIGTFLVRNSSDPRFLFSLSLQTDRGPTSVRLCYLNGYFRLDAQSHLQPAMPLFTSVIELVQYYVKRSKLCRNDTQVWVDPQGRWYSSITLDKPLKKDKSPPTLKHLARMAVHKAIQDTEKPTIKVMPPPHTQLELPTSLLNYLSEYPYSL